MELQTRVSLGEEDEDIEALRMVALQSLKKNSMQIKNNNVVGAQYGGFMGSPRGKAKRGKFGRLQQGRLPRNGQFNNFNNGWTRNTNLISVPMVTEEGNLTNEPSKSVSVNEAPKLILPQDRYCKKTNDDQQTRVDSVTTKFDRYDNSDQSDSSDEEDSDNKSSNSLDALMEELENEIQGVADKITKDEKPAKTVKTKRKQRKLSTSAHVTETNEIECVKTVEPEPETKINLNVTEKLTIPSTARSPVARKWPPQHVKPRRHIISNLPPPPMPVAMQHIQAPPIQQELAPPLPPPPPNVNVIFPAIQGFSGYPVMYSAPPPMVYEVPPPRHVVPPPGVFGGRSLSPLVIGTDSYVGSTLGPLSPRSAAFVLQNRAIVEKRKRRSYSRSPSPLPRFRRSKSPKRSSVSPKRQSKSPPIRRRSLSPSPSPIRKVLPLNSKISPSKKTTIHERLGAKQNSNKTDREEDKNSNTSNKSKEKSEDAVGGTIERKAEVLDPVLEARRRKFEKNEITIKEGVIKLKLNSKEDNTKQEESNSVEEEDVIEDLELDEDALLEADDGLVIDALFSDEESDSDNEGRFKTKQESIKKIAVLPFAKLINGEKSGAKSNSKLSDAKRRGDGDRREKPPTSDRFRSRSPAKTSGSSRRKVLKPVDKKIEIKIRNPGKYEKNVEERKLEVSAEKERQTGDSSSEFNFEVAEEALSSTSAVSEGDLRAQLSRKRAERQKQPLPDVVPSRLLQSALQDAGFRKNKNKKGKEKTTEALVEAKLPIHMRLGAASSQEVFGGKKSRNKSQGQGKLEQV